MSDNSVKRCVEEYIRREFTDKGKVFCNFCPDRQRNIRLAAEARFRGMDDESRTAYLTNKTGKL